MIDEATTRNYVYTVNELSTYQIELLNFLESDFGTLAFVDRLRIETEIQKITRIIKYKLCLLKVPNGCYFLRQRIYQIDINTALSDEYYKLVRLTPTQIW